MDMREMLFYYGLILCAYIPGIIGIFKFKFYGKFPLILFCFIGMFVFHAVGSILVFHKQVTVTGVPLFSYEFIIMLIAEVLIFYVITWPYLFYRKNIEYNEYNLKARTGDYLVIPLLLLLIGLILYIYYRNVGTFLVFDLLSRALNQHTAGDIRAERYYGLTDYSFYSMGFVILPGLLASHLFFTVLLKKRFSKLNIFLILLCFIPNILLGEKSGMLRMALMLFITYTIFLGISNKPLIKIVSLKSAVFFLMALIPTVIAYFLYFGTGQGRLYVIKNLVYRIFGVYSETLAAVIPMAENYGLFQGNTLPKFQGLLADPGNHIVLDAQMHYYLFGGEGSAPVPAVGEGYVNYGWPGFIFFAALLFITLIILQELFIRLRFGPFSYAIMALFAYFAIYTNFNGIFATILFPQYYILFLLAICIWMVNYLFLDFPTRVRSSG